MSDPVKLETRTSYWNYRVLKDEFGTLTIREVYYNDKDEVVMHSLDPDPVAGDTIEDLHGVLHQMSEALSKPVLDVSIET